MAGVQVFIWPDHYVSFSAFFFAVTLLLSCSTETEKDLIGQSFQNQYLQDYWITVFIQEHLETHGYPNVQPFLEQYGQKVKTPEFKLGMDEALQAIETSREDHTVSIYKASDGFKLEAHIFTPPGVSIEIRPAIVIFHGGGWNSGNPSWAFARARHFAELGFLKR